MLWTVLFDTEQYTGATEEEEKEKETFKTHVILADSCLYTPINICLFNIFLLLVFIM